MSTPESMGFDANKFKAFKRKPVTLTQEALVKSDYLAPEQKLPLVMQPTVSGVDLVAWAGGHRELIETELVKHGGILFRNFGVNSEAKFEEFVRAISSGLIEYGERSSPRTKLSGNVYTSTDHPADQPIVLHNEQSYTLNWPMKIAFFCAQAPQQGGRTPIADNRKITKRLSPSTVEKFAERQIMYVRNYGDGLGLSWQEVFGTSSQALVEEHCRKVNIEVEWKDGERLRTRQIRPAFRVHPRSGETVWFNHALFFNVLSLEKSARELMLSLFKEDELPTNTFYGDGSPIEPSVIEELREAYDQETVSFPWQEGDVLVLDNMLSSHGREPFVGPRKIAAAMADLFSTASQS